MMGLDGNRERRCGVGRKRGRGEKHGGRIEVGERREEREKRSWREGEKLEKERGGTICCLLRKMVVLFLLYQIIYLDTSLVLYLF